MKTKSSAKIIASEEKQLKKLTERQRKGNYRGYFFVLIFLIGLVNILAEVTSNLSVSVQSSFITAFFVNNLFMGKQYTFEEGLGLHSTIGVVVTADGTFGELQREMYEPAEERTISELKTLNKPFVVLLNSLRPESDEAMRLAIEMKNKYGVTVLPVNCNQLKKEDIASILSAVLKEFPISQISFNMPSYIEMLDCNHYIKASIIKTARNIINMGKFMKDIDEQDVNLLSKENEYIDGIMLSEKDLSAGNIKINFNIADNFSIFY